MYGYARNLGMFEQFEEQGSDLMWSGSFFLVGDHGPHDTWIKWVRVILQKLLGIWNMVHENLFLFYLDVIGVYSNIDIYIYTHSI